VSNGDGPPSRMTAYDLQRNLRFAPFVAPDGSELMQLVVPGLAPGLARAAAADAVAAGAICRVDDAVRCTLTRAAAVALAADWTAAPGLHSVGLELAAALQATPGSIGLPDGRALSYASRPLLMGILNLTPDSFYAPSRVAADDALRRALLMAEQGADIVDLGGESTRPGAEMVTEADELARVVPVIARLVAAGAPPISIDSQKPAVVRVALDAGAVIVNDVGGLRDPAMASLVASSGAPVVVMHMRGTPRTMQESPQYEDVVAEVLVELKTRLNRAFDQGVLPHQIVVDPGLGFGKRLQDNVRLIAAVPQLLALGPVLIGASRKSFLGSIVDAEVEERLLATIAAHTVAQSRGASILRVHDVEAALQAVRVVAALDSPRRGARP
jgi:dihydropteroate synthase